MCNFVVGSARRRGKKHSVLRTRSSPMNAYRVRVFRARVFWHLVNETLENRTVSKVMDDVHSRVSITMEKAKTRTCENGVCYDSNRTQHTQTRAALVATPYRINRHDNCRDAVAGRDGVAQSDVWPESTTKRHFYRGIVVLIFVTAFPTHDTEMTCFST